MQGQAVCGSEEARFGENKTASVDSAQGRAFTVQPFEPATEPARIAGERLEPGHHEQCLRVLDRVEGRLGAQRNTVACGHRRPIDAEDMPAVQVVAEAVRHPQRLDC